MLDYPPFFAYFEYLLSIPAAFIDSNLVKISATPISTRNVVLYQKCTVILTDFFVYLGAVCLSSALKFKPKQSLLFIVLVVANYGLGYENFLNFIFVSFFFFSFGKR